MNYDANMKPVPIWNGPPDLKPVDWPEVVYTIQSWNGPPEFKPDDWEEKQPTPAVYFSVILY